MEVKRRSFFKDPEKDRAWFDNWVSRLEILNQKRYDRIGITTVAVAEQFFKSSRFVII
ncbi:hypothetical protein LXM25_03055 [Dyadobacter sp. LJ53]|uniref:hypothetical protein n=1 Tax=Dyadobacter chenwenxiniae TaxID=2906456 RepID=UPI001F448887|nr:hypothetical protein [Dyadobacter chenwenxiniae]MCF0049020.1 hypothetical protein [Dyadobacter chenwenxiniae]